MELEKDNNKRNKILPTTYLKMLPVRQQVLFVDRITNLGTQIKIMFHIRTWNI